MEKRTFKKRSGTTNRGRDYENAFLANIILKLLHRNLEDFLVTSNDQDFGAFDDVVIETKSKIRAIQLKHFKRERLLSKNALTEKSGNFSLKKYFGDFTKLKNCDVTVELILFTNLKFVVPENEKLELKVDDVLVKIFQTLADPLLNTCCDGCCYKFETDEERYQQFFKHFSLYTNQMNVEKIQEDSGREFEEMFGTFDKNIYKNYLDFINDWSLVERKKYKLSKSLMQRVVILSVLSPSIIPFNFRKNDTNDNSNLLTKAISSFNTTIFGKNNVERVIQMYGNLDTELQNIEEVNKIGLKYRVFSKYVTVLENLNALEKTKLLWLMDKCPLIIMENETMYKCIQLFPDGKFIVIGEETTRVSFRSLIDLNPGSDLYKQILTNFHCSIQGKQKVSLKVLIEQDERFRTIITTNELVQMLNYSLAVGGKAESLPVPYINRYLTRNLVDLKFLQQVTNSVIVISCRNKFDQIRSHFTRFTIVNVEEYLTKTMREIWSDNEIFLELGQNNKTLFISENECSSQDFDSICKRNPSKISYHHFRIVGEYLECVRGFRGPDNIEEYLVNTPLEESKLLEVSVHIQIICGDAGMGKTVLTKSLKNQLPSTDWAVLISPKDHTMYFREKSYDTNFFSYIFKDVNSTDLKFLEILKEMRQIVFIWDALDEIAEENFNSVITVIDSLSKQNFRQILTARSNLRNVLEEIFGVFARGIKPFEKEDQGRYIRGRLSVCDEDVITKINRNIGLVQHIDILGVPLQIFMLTELFRKDIEKYRSLLSGEDSMFSLTDIYHHFVDEKFNVYYKEKVQLEVSNDVRKQMIESSKKERWNNYEKVSVKMFFEEINVKCDQFLEEIRRSGDYFGIITEVSPEGIPNFVHKFYAEYFAALYWSKNYENLPRLLLFIDRYKNIRFLFDLIVTKNCIGHVAVLYRNLPVLKNCSNELGCKDEIGRSALHLACSWAKSYVLLKTKETGLLKKKYIVNDAQAQFIEGESIEFQEIFEFLLKHCDPEEVDGFLGWNCFSYINEFSLLLPTIMLAKKGEFINSKNIGTILYFSVKFDYDKIFEIIKHIPLVETRGRQSLLHLAVKFNAKNFLKKLLHQHLYSKRINKEDNSGSSPIYVACQYKHLEIVHLLLEAKADFDNVNRKGETPLDIACSNGCTDIVQTLISFGADINLPNGSGTTPFYSACSNGHIQIVKLLMDLKVDCDVRGDNEFTPLGVASMKKYTEIVKLLLTEGRVDVNAVKDTGFTPLHLACFGGQVDIVRLLCDHHASINVANSDGLSPLHVACFRGNTQIVQELITRGADINAVDNTGFTAVFVACDRNRKYILQYLIYECQAKVNVKAMHGLTPLQLVCQKGNHLVAQMLIEAGANVDACNDAGVTPLALTARQGFKKCVEVLIEAKANVNFADRDGVTPLHQASMSGNLEIVKMLVDAGADVGARAKDGSLPWISANACGYMHIAHFLKSLLK